MELQQAAALLPGHELVNAGLRDLRAGLHSVEALLLARAPERLAACGIELPAHDIEDPEAELYRLLCAREGHGAHSAYNALSRRLVSYLTAAERYAPAR